MRLRHTVIASTSALLLALAAANPANAATGDFEYRGSLGFLRTLEDPASQECINLPNTTQLTPGSSPFNKTLSTATVFLDYDCNGDIYYVLNPGQKLGFNVKLRSVVFN
ncbi:hypothetical protein [Streptomyces erythrochromogenes]|uniref:hypothetical protein n=1 Tax=Streptomyces erythrochromogenes TaxID=285574 RepID=UPI0038635A90|nr:hypothetical protein OG489_34065 [Streptomyces erythrochromogenes]